jgi:hypothetical protein
MDKETGSARLKFNTAWSVWLAPCREFFRRKPIPIVQLVKSFPNSHGNWRFNTVFTAACLWSEPESAWSNPKPGNLVSEIHYNVANISASFPMRHLPFKCILKDSDAGVKYSGLAGFLTLSILLYSAEHDVSETWFVSFLTWGRGHLCWVR